MAELVPTGYRPEFVTALQLFGEASETVAAAGHPRPTLVGGAALELWTTGAYTTGDFDLLTAETEPMETALLARGFRREARPGHVLRGLYHPDLDIAVEFCE